MREGTSGDTFYIISDGDVRVTKKTAGREEEIRSLSRGDYFGEQVIDNWDNTDTICAGINSKNYHLSFSFNSKVS